MTTASVAELWRTKKSFNWNYFEQADRESDIRPFWGDGWPFLPLFNTLDLRSTLEIACGKGRHAAQCVDRVGDFHLMDTSVDAIALVKKRFAGRRNVHVHLSKTGTDLPFIRDASLTSVYSYDAMVHFEVETMAGYLREIGRALKPGGRALLHHSNSSDEGARDLLASTGWRNYMTADLFAHLANRGGMDVVERHVLDWARPDSDALTMLVKRQP